MLTDREIMLRGQEAAIVNDEARLANDIQRQRPDLTRTQALREAAEIVRRHGIGWVVHYTPPGR